MLHPVVQRDRSLHMTTPSNALCGKRILLADNEAEVRVGWSIRLEGFGLSVESCASGAELEHILTTRSAAFDAVTVDLKGMGSDHTFEQALSTLAQTFAAVPFIILSSDDTLAWKFLKSSNIRGYALKIDQVEALCAILTHVLLHGKTGVYSPSVRIKNRLSPAQLQVLKLIAREGLTQRDIAERLAIAPSTVEDHCKGILDRLTDDRTRSMPHAVYVAAKAGLV
jgi:DNA-binding NarL/FixJ family response regulator